MPNQTISSGGTYSGLDLTQTSPSDACILINTTSPVIIEDSELTSKGDIFDAGVGGIDLTVRNCLMHNQHPGVSGSNNGYILYAQNGPHRLLFENNFWEKSGGIRVVGWATVTGSSRFVVRYNDIQNIQASTTDSTTTYSTTSRSLQHRFILLREAMHLPEVEVGWNRVRNWWGDSACEDVISMYGTGTDFWDTLPYHVHHNLIQGGHGPVNSSGWSGGGCITDGNAGLTEFTTSHGIVQEQNIVLDSMNYGFKISQGHHNKMINNVMIRDGIALGGFVYADETQWYTTGHTSGSGLGVLNAKSETFYGCHEATGNVMGWLDPDTASNLRNSNTPGCDDDPTTSTLCSDPSVCTGNTALAVADLSTEKQAAIDGWLADVETNNFTIGPIAEGAAASGLRAGIIRL